MDTEQIIAFYKMLSGPKPQFVYFYECEESPELSLLFVWNGLFAVSLFDTSLQEIDVWSVESDCTVEQIKSHIEDYLFYYKSEYAVEKECNDICANR